MNGRDESNALYESRGRHWTATSTTRIILRATSSKANAFMLNALENMQSAS